MHVSIVAHRTKPSKNVTLETSRRWVGEKLLSVETGVARARKLNLEAEGRQLTGDSR